MGAVAARTLSELRAGERKRENSGRAAYAPADWPARITRFAYYVRRVVSIFRLFLKPACAPFFGLRFCSLPIRSIKPGLEQRNGEMEERLGVLVSFRPTVRVRGHLIHSLFQR